MSKWWFMYICTDPSEQWFFNMCLLSALYCGRGKHWDNNMLTAQSLRDEANIWYFSKNSFFFGITAKFSIACELRRPGPNIMQKGARLFFWGEEERGNFGLTRERVLPFSLEDGKQSRWTCVWMGWRRKLDWLPGLWEQLSPSNNSPRRRPRSLNIWNMFKSSKI